MRYVLFFKFNLLFNRYLYGPPRTSVPTKARHYDVGPYDLIVANSTNTENKCFLPFWAGSIANALAKEKAMKTFLRVFYIILAVAVSLLSFALVVKTSNIGVDVPDNMESAVSEASTIENSDSNSKYPAEDTSSEAVEDTSSEEDNIAPVVYSEGLEFELLSNGTYAVSGIGSCTDTDVYIPDKYNDKAVTSIGYYAFYYCKSITSITIPNSVTSIGIGAFAYCKSLTSITIPNSVTSIGKDAFCGCGSLTSITIPESVTSIGSGAFYSCEFLTSITIPNSVTSIGNHAFYSCDSLTSITIPNSVTSIGDSAFSFCDSLTSITIPNSVTSIGRYAFAHCDSLTSITIPNNVTSIGDSAFYSCDSLTDIYCDVASKPNGWDVSWKINCNATVHWGS